MKSSKQWPVTVKIQLDVCPRCGESHGETIYRRFELGDPLHTHWSHCVASGEPLLINMNRPQLKQPDKFKVHFVSADREATGQPDPNYPSGIDVVLRGPEWEGKSKCRVQLPYPAPCVGAWKVECTECGARLGCTAAGRADDPRSLELPCRK